MRRHLALLSFLLACGGGSTAPSGRTDKGLPEDVLLDQRVEDGLGVPETAEEAQVAEEVQVEALVAEEAPIAEEAQQDIPSEP